MVQLLLVFGDWGIFLLRVVFGAILIAYGWFNFKSSPKKVNVIFSLGEVICGLFIVFGFLTQFAAFLVAIKYLISFFSKVKQRQKIVSGFDFDLLMLAVALALVTLGGGLYALDVYLGILFY